MRKIILNTIIFYMVSLYLFIMLAVCPWIIFNRIFEWTGMFSSILAVIITLGLNILAFIYVFNEKGKPIKIFSKKVYKLNKLDFSQLKCIKEIYLDVDREYYYIHKKYNQAFKISKECIPDTQERSKYIRQTIRNGILI